MSHEPTKAPPAKSPPFLVDLERVSYAAGDSLLLRELSWRLQPGQHWAVLGANGAGKSTFLRLVRGELWPLPSSRARRRYTVDGQVTTSPLLFRERTGLVSSELLNEYQRRDWNLTGLEVVVSGITGGHLLYHEPSDEQWQKAERLLAKLELGHLARRPLLSLSLGQAKQVLIARALVSRPNLLLLDEPCEGLDAPSRQRLLAMLGRVAAGGTQLVYATHRGAELAPGTSHALLLAQGAIKLQGPLQSVLRAGGLALLPSPQAALPSPPPAPARGSFLARARASQVNVEHKPVLFDLAWEIRPGENWLVLGPNGAGKTTLLRLLAGELRPQHGGSMDWFGSTKPRNLQKLRQEIGLVSAGLQARHFHRQSGLDTVASGLLGSVGLRGHLDQEQRGQARAWLERLGLMDLAHRDITTLSYGQLRKLLIARAMATNPRLLLLDEPLAGLDAPARAEVNAILALLASQGATLVGVTHYPEEMMAYMSHVAVLEAGRMVFQGTVSRYLRGQSGQRP
ncbi:MAG: ATP-binding cassette domain-containing protein [Proteobacteria bacterium]|nr:ATP-binding cassette domain-containing protein [Pseudomonadota bacterium]MBU1451632.1 ATP-binding cassette domain-containing protein [Pseudomonadota bacterium]MBU2469295.1 ATP-binding cassette domain-containing protein [Pseudomonadota bacterium]MBU2518005.1 ATP-binding cassette domain-containing protein [Pseudomonadota bacterium]